MGNKDDKNGTKQSAASAKKKAASGSRSAVGGRGGLREGRSTLDVFSLDDVGGLPLEVWRVVLAYLHVNGLCCASQVG